jgi:hypothetical protein
MDTFISYEGLPIKAGGAHSLGKRSIDEIYSQSISFLQTFAAIQNSVIEITFFNSQDKIYNTLPYLWMLTRKFGLPSWNSWNLKSKRQHYWTWKVKPTKVDQALQVLNSFLKLPSNEYGPVVLSFLWHFHFKDLQSGDILKGQEQIPVLDKRNFNSQLYLRLGQKSTVSVWFTLPFNEQDERAIDYITKLSNALPFKPSEKHWRLWKKTKSGNWQPKVLEIKIN